jgi:hypothetical protein
VSITVNDLGNSGSGGAKAATSTIPIAVQAINDPPHISLPLTQTATEDVPLTFSSSNSNAITISDVDAGSNAVSVTISASVGTLTLGHATGLTFVTGDGTADSSMTFTGSLAAINSALDGMVLATPQDYTGATAVHVAMSDLGNSGVGGALADAATVAVTVNADATNQTPHLSIPGPQRTAVSTPIVLSNANGNRISFTDDSGNNPVSLALSVTNGTVTLSNSVGAETQVNTYTTQTQDEVFIAMRPSGDYIAVWESNGQDGDGYGIYGQRFDSHGQALGSEFRVNTTTAKDQSMPTVAVNSLGEFVVAWVSDNQDSSGAGIFAQRFDASGNRVGSEMLINSTVGGNQVAPSVALSDAGVLVVVWQSADASGEGVFAQLFDANDEPSGSEFQANTTSANDQVAPRVAMDSSGNFVIVWQGKDVSQDGIFAQRYDATGATLGGEFPVNTTTAGAQVAPAIAMDAAGNFAIAWQGIDAAGSGIFAQRYNAAGGTVGGEIPVNTTTVGNQTVPDIALNSNGQLVVAWQGPDATNQGIFAQIYAANGAPLSRELVANTTTAGNQVAPTVGIAADGTFAVAWTSDNQDGSQTAVMSQRFRRGDELTYSVGDGVSDSAITLTGTLADINAALDGILFTPTTAFAGTASIQLTINDLGQTGSGGAKTTSGQVDIVVGNSPLIDLDANDSSGAAGSGYRATFRPGLGAVRVADTDATLADPNSGIKSLKVQITNLLDGNKEVLTATTTGTSIVAAYNTASGLLSLTGNDTVAHYQQVLRTIFYNNTATTPNATQRNITFVANDGTADSNIATVAVKIALANNAPVAVGDSYTVADTGSLAVGGQGVLTNDSDPDSDPITAVLVAGPSHGTFALAGDGTFTYTPTAGFSGADSFTYKANDGAADSNVVTVTINVTHSNTAPVNSVPAAQTTNQATAIVFSTSNGNAITVADSDAAANPVQVTLGVADGTLTLPSLTGLTLVSGGNGTSSLSFTGTVAAINAAMNGLTYLPTASFSGTDTLQVTTNDLGNTGTGGALSDVDSVSITVVKVNHAPVLSGANNLTPVIMNDVSSAGTLVSTLIAGQVSDVEADAVYGIAVTAVSNTNGTWQYSIDDGANWTLFGSPAATSARLLAADDATLVRFVPAANFFGTVANGLVFRAWDQTTGVAGTTADASLNGGATAFSVATASVSVLVNRLPVAVNDSYTVTEGLTVTASVATGVLNNDSARECCQLHAQFRRLVQLRARRRRKQQRQLCVSD